MSNKKVIKVHCLTIKKGKKGDFPSNMLIPRPKLALEAINEPSLSKYMYHQLCFIRIDAYQMRK